MGYETLANIPSMSLSENWAARIPTKLETRKLFIKMANLGIWGVTEKMEYFWFQWVCSKRSLWKPIICRSCSGGFCHGFKPISTNFVRKSPLYILYILYYCYYIYIYPMLPHLEPHDPAVSSNFTTKKVHFHNNITFWKTKNGVSEDRVTQNPMIQNII